MHREGRIVFMKARRICDSLIIGIAFMWFVDAIWLHRLFDYLTAPIAVIALLICIRTLFAFLSCV